MKWRKVKSKWCKVCGISRADEVHHIKARVDGGDHEEGNLIDLCTICHKHSPSDPDDFFYYKRDGGPIVATMRQSAVTTFISKNEWKKIKTVEQFIVYWEREFEKACKKIQTAKYE